MVKKSKQNRQFSRQNLVKKDLELLYLLRITYTVYSMQNGISVGKYIRSIWGNIRANYYLVITVRKAGNRYNGWGYWEDTGRKGMR
jgi:hypothetical protein